MSDKKNKEEELAKEIKPGQFGEAAVYHKEAESEDRD